MAIAYFRSGWAFLIPYLAAYLVYAWLKWPVNPANGNAMPALLHVFQALHIGHAILGIYAVRRYCSEHIDQRKRAIGNLIWPVIPWALLALLFWIPGLYMELPADPWAHYIRVSEWEYTQQVTQHSTWLKFGYFISYTLITGGRSLLLSSQFVRLEIFYTICCLLLCWQYYRLGRAVGLGHTGAFIFVLLQSLIFGNNIFSFYRYYGISSSLFAQLGAVAFTRIILTIPGNGSPLASCDLAISSSPRAFLVSAVSCLLLLLFIAMNHPQGLGIVALSAAAVGLWRLLQWRRANWWIIPVALLLLSVLVVEWWPRQPAVAEIYRPQGWLTTFSGFNLFTASPALDRTIAIVGWAGLFNLLAGAFLLRRNHIVGWLTISPIVFLCLPCVAIPLANALSQHNSNPANIITFHRLFFAIPPGLALVALGSSLLERYRSEEILISVQWRGHLAILFLFSAIFFFTLAPTAAPGFNRFYNSVAKSPDDIGIKPAFRIIDNISSTFSRRKTGPVSLAIGELVYASRTEGLEIGEAFRVTSYISAPSRPVTDVLVFLRNSPEVIFVPLTGRELYTSASLAGYLSGHWSPQKVALGSMGGVEFEQSAMQLGYEEISARPPRIYVHLSTKIQPVIDTEPVRP